MNTLKIVCPFCQANMVIAHDGLYRPRWATCEICGERFIYEPLAKRVETFKPREAPYASNPDFREIEMSGHAEQ